MNRVDVKEKARSRDLRILSKWKQEDTFRKSITNREGKPNFVFYEAHQQLTVNRISVTCWAV